MENTAMRWKWVVSSVATLLTLMISVANIMHQYLNLCKPKLQLCICRILTMIPVYAVVSYISYLFVDYAAPLNIVRDCYEGYVMFSFLQLLILYMGGDQVILSVLESKKIKAEIWPHHHFNQSLNIVGLASTTGSIDSNEEISVNIIDIYPDCFCEKKDNLDEVSINNDGIRESESGSQRIKIARFYSFIKLGVLQFVVLKPISALISLFLESVGLYGSGTFSFKRGFLYIAILNSISVSLSVYSLFLLYISISEQLAPIRPVLKFFCIKLIIFMSFWQSIILSILNYSGIYPNEPNYTIKLHNWLLTLEMTLCAIIYGVAFTIKKDFKNYIESSQGYVQDNDNMDKLYKHTNARSKDFFAENENGPNHTTDLTHQTSNKQNFPSKTSTQSPHSISKNIKFIISRFTYIVNPKDIIQDTINTFRFFKLIRKSSSAEIRLGKNHSDILVNATDIKERKRKWKLAFCSAQECVNALDYMLENGLETLLNTQEKLRMEEGFSEREKELKMRQNEFDSILNETEEGLRKAIESVLIEIKSLSEECRHLEKEFLKKASNIPNIIENMNKNDTKFDSEYLGKKVTVEDIHNLQNTRKELLEHLDQLRKDEEALNKEIQNLEIKWNAYRKKTQRLETEISLKKTETSHQAIQVDAHINRRLSTCNSIRPDKENYQNINEGGQSLEQTGTRRKRRDSVVKWIGRLSIASSAEEKIDQICDHELNTMKIEESTKLDTLQNNTNIIEDKDEEVQGELQVLNLLSLVKIEQPESDEVQPSNTGPPSSILKLKVDPSPLLSKFLDPNFTYSSGLEPIYFYKENSSKTNKFNEGLFSKGALDFSLKVRNQCDGSKSFEEISMCSQGQNAPERSINSEDIALFNIFVGELKRNENIPVSSIGKLLCSTLK
ncbi:uncharacterized protein cubi_00796 [Cryptosporidium ubiquitum]|uniref:Uncharacterized protein n=1 Tax=Cryptosporidium ubiquitum TaxID=857276 RepID=A0A1J4MB11_9CRYT|nr:uncharacterized protein cubi_00796 [Cryptosporidium ubiquitum]OII71418.1 hypothetical protein cubi_00796 [Cryptosporidium ubiquitum]